MMKDVKVSAPTKELEGNKKEDVIYNITKGIAEVKISASKKEKPLIEESVVRFESDIKRVVRLAINYIPIIEDRIRNNKMVIAMSQDLEVELEKAKKHLANNENTLKATKEFISKNTK